MRELCVIAVSSLTGDEDETLSVTPLWSPSLYRYRHMRPFTTFQKDVHVKENPFTSFLAAWADEDQTEDVGTGSVDATESGTTEEDLGSSREGSRTDDEVVQR